MEFEPTISGCMSVPCDIRILIESTLCNWQNIMELPAWNRRYIWNLSDCNGIRTRNQIITKH